MAGLRQALRILLEASGPRRGELNALRMFAGLMAKTADHGALTRAQAMAEQGASREDIWRDTGWFKGVDGKWRWEIDDSGTRIGDEAVDFYLRGELVGAGRPFAGNARDILKHPGLFEAYPEMGGRMTQIERTTDPFRYNGDYTPGSGRIRVAAPDTATTRSALLHESQHAIQRAEGFPTGGSPTQYNQQREAQIAQEALSWRRELAKMREKMPAADRHAVENAVIQEYQRLDMMDWLPSREVRDIAGDTLGNPDEQLREVTRLYGTDQRVTPLRPKEVYDRLAGEVEARNVQTRRDFTPEERRTRPPWETQDVPDEQQIVRFDGGRATNALGDAIRIGAGLGGAALAGDITLRELLREQRQRQY